MKPYRYVVLIILLFVLKAQAQQTFPVLAGLQINPPYSLYLSDYTAPGTDKMQLNLFLKDLEKGNYQCRLRVKIEGFGITIQSKNDFYAPPIYLNSGAMTAVSGSELSPYFNPQNLVFQGIDPSSFAKNGGKLPDGVYRFTIEVLDYYRRSVVSNPATSVVSVFLSYPPIINLPLDKSTVNITEPQNLIFQWMPRHTGSVNAAYHVAYKFRLVELIPQDRDPNDAVRTTRPIYETYTDQTVLLYGPSEPILIPGTRYAVQVQAVEADGKDIFMNNGNSEVVSFTYGERCSLPKSLTAQLVSATSLKFSWIPQPQQQSFIIRYRESGNQTAQWFEQEVYVPQYIARGLRPGKTYEYQLKAQCPFGYGDYTALQTFVMPDEKISKGDFVCGTVTSLEKPDKDDMLSTLSYGMVFLAGDFPITVTNATGQDGVFSGTGRVGIPFINQLSFPVAFSKISISTKLKLVDGKVSIAQTSLSESIQNIIAAYTVTPDSLGRATIGAESGKVYFVNAAVDTTKGLPVYKPEDKTVSFATPEGKQITLTIAGNIPITFQDSNQQTYEVTKDGKLRSLGKKDPASFFAGGTQTSYALNTMKAKAVFSNTTRSSYGYDAFNENWSGNRQYNTNYQKLSDNGKDAWVSWKSVETSRGEEVQVTIEKKDQSFDISKVQFRTGEGKKVDSKYDKSAYTFNVTGATEGNDREVYAWYPDGKDTVNIGKLNIASYKKIAKKLVLVSVNGAGSKLDKNAVEKYLNEVYKQAVVEWNVDRIETFADSSWDANKDGLDVNNSSSFSAYTAEQKALVNTYRANHKLEDNTYYVFIINKFSDAGQEGYMVRNGQVGFVKSGADIQHTLAHELGHGAFALEHTWENGGPAKGTTRNLMDYDETVKSDTSGFALWKRQWDYMRNPDMIFRPFEGDEEGGYETDGHYSTVYLVSLMLGMEPEKARKLAEAAEDPDTDIHSNIDFELDQTWSYFGDQQEIHSLTGGFHGVEEMMTAFKFLLTDIDDVKSLGECLHRYGDTYAHSRLDNINPKDLLDSDNDSTKLESYIKSWKLAGGEDLEPKIGPIMKYLNYFITKYGYQFLSNMDVQKKFLHGKNLPSYLHDIYLNQPTDVFRMYGNNFYTGDHASTDKSLPDFIYVRPAWYMTYVKNLAVLISYKYNFNPKKADFNLFQKMVDFSSINRCSLKGIIDYEIAKKTNKKYFHIPVYYAKLLRVGAKIDETVMTNYLETAQLALEKTLRYMKEKDGRTARISAIYSNKQDLFTDYNIMAYKIKFD